MNLVQAFGDVASMIAQMAPEKIVQLKAPNGISERVEHLVNLKKTGYITTEEATELERFLALDLFIGLEKARANQLLTKQ